LNLPQEYNTGLLIVEGEITINDNTSVSQHQYTQFKNEEGIIKIKAGKKSNLLLLSGEPINEPVGSVWTFRYEYSRRNPGSNSRC
jgi:quercetin 2,3-dioxygenase